MRFYTTAVLGPKRRKTPEGFLVIEDVPLGRTGTQEYGPDETPIPPGENGRVEILRTAEEVFKPAFMASLNGKPFVNDHPDEDVTPRNWKDYTCGFVMNPRRSGELLLGDIVVMCPESQRDIDEGKRELSIGYDTDWIELGPGRGEQRNMIANHVALVDQGRCGLRCAIGDEDPSTKERPMKTKKGFWDRVRDAMAAKDEKRVTDLLDAGEEAFGATIEGASGAKLADDAEPAGGGDTHIHVGGEGGLKGAADDHEERLGKLEQGHAEIKDSLEEIKGMIKGKEKPADDGEGGISNADKEKTEQALKDEVPPGLEKEAVKSKDSVYLQDSFQETVSLAEIIAPGIKTPVFDQALAPAKTFHSICSLRRKALDLGWSNPETRGMIESVIGDGRTLDTAGMSCPQARAIFRAVGGMKRAANNGRTHDNGGSAFVARNPSEITGGPRNVAELQIQIDKMYGKGDDARPRQ